jgi:hypothetical protein
MTLPAECFSPDRLKRQPDMHPAAELFPPGSYLIKQLFSEAL